MKIQTRKIKLTKPKYRRRSSDEIKEIAKGILDQSIFTSQHLHEQEMLDNLAWLDKQDTLRVEKLMKIHDDALEKIDSIAV